MARPDKSSSAKWSKIPIEPLPTGHCPVSILLIQCTVPRFWRFIYAVSFFLSLIQGYRSVLPGQVKDTDAEWFLVPLAFLGGLILPLFFMAYSRYRRGAVEVYRRPTFDRWPLGWWNDTLQPIRLTLIGSVLQVIGAVLALPRVDQRGAMVFGMYAALAVGLTLGERLVYRVFTDRIAAAPRLAAT